MIKILCPTDFSDHSKKALEFTFSLAKALEAEIHMVTVYREHMHSSSFKSVKTYIEDVNLKELNKLCAELKSNHNYSTDVHLSVLEGYTTEKLKYYASSMEIDLIVMGTQGSKSVNNRLFGSVTSKLLKQVKIPILAIPYHTLYRFSRGHFLFPVDNKAIYNNEGFTIVNSICKKLDKKIDLLHVKSPNENEAYPFDPFINQFLDGHINKVLLIDAVDTTDYIEKYIKEHPVEMLIMLRREHSFLNQLFVQSNTDKELAQTQVPILIIPE